MASLSLVFDILARDRASSEFRKIGDAADSVGKKTSGMSKVVAGAMNAAKVAAVSGATALAGGFAIGLKGAIEYEKITARTANVLKTTGGVAGVTAKDIANLGGEISNYSGMTNEAVESGANLLLTFTNIRNSAGEGNDIFTQTTRIMADMSKALGQDTSASALQLGKALNDPIKGVTALQRVGVSFTESQKEQIKKLQESGDLMGAQKVILGELNTQFGGAAKAAGSTFAGQLDKLKNTFGDLLRDAVLPLLPSLAKVAAWLSERLPAAFALASGFIGRLSTTFGGVFTEVTGGIRAFAAAWKYNDGEITSSGLPGFMERLGYWARQTFEFIKNTVIPTAQALAQWIGNNREILVGLVAGFAAFKVMMAGLAIMTAVSHFMALAKAVGIARAVQLQLNIALAANPIGIVITVLAALVAAVVIAYQKSETFRNIVNAAWSSIRSTITTVWNGGIKPVFNAFTSLIQAVHGGFRTAVDGIGSLWAGLKAKLRAPVAWVVDVVWNNGLRALWNTANNLWGGKDLPAFSFADGGYTGPGSKHTPAGIVHAGEYVFTQEQVKQLGVNNLEALANGEVILPGYAEGGLVKIPGWLRWIPGMGKIADIANSLNGMGAPGGGLFAGGVFGLAKTMASKLWEKALSLLGGGADGGTGVRGKGALGGTWHSIWQVVKAAIPGARINSTFRPGDPGYHGRNKAIDFGFGSGPGGAGSAGLASIDRFLHDNFGGSLAELIYDGLGNNRPNIKNGVPFRYSPATQAQHRNHVHAAVYDGGGLLPPGLSVAYNGTGRDETVRTAEQEAALRQGGQTVVIQTYDNPKAIVRALAAHEQMRAALAPTW